MHRKIRITFFLDDVRIGGSQKLTLDAVRLISKELFEVRLVVLYRSVKEDQLNLSDLDDTQIVFANLPDSLSILSNVISLMKYVMVSDLVVSTGFDCGIYLSLLKYFSNDKRIYVSVIHGIDGYYIDDEYLNRFKKNFGVLHLIKDKIITNTFLRFFDRFITVSSAMNDFLVTVRKVAPEKIRTVFFGTEFSRLEFLSETEIVDLRLSNGIGLKDFVICYAGRLTYAKGLETLIEKTSDFLKSNDDIKLILNGDGELHEYLHSEIRKYKLDGKVLVTGFVPETDKYIQISDVLILPSKSESTNLGVQVAMYFGKIVLCSNIGGLRDLVDDSVNGYLFTVNDYSEMIKKLVYIHKNRFSLNHIGKNANVKMVEKFDLSRNIQNVEKELIKLFKN
jgi:glycosyltransferase involved in cell wall biosynthesis